MRPPAATESHSVDRREPSRVPDTPDLDGFDAVVYDLDGTLCRLAVDWDAVASDAAAVFDDHGHDVDGRDLWAMLDDADEYGIRGPVEEVVAAAECDGARVSERLPLADDPPRRRVPRGVCSLNAERAVRLALSVHDLTDHVGAVVGRDTVATRKPHPEPLLATLRELGVDPGEAVFVGDSERDAVTAERAGVAFRYVDGTP
jgi:phosphoglycolate phosphatase